MNARKYLRSLQNKGYKMQLKQKQIQQLKERLLSISVSMDKEQVSHSTNVAAMAETMAKLVDMQKEFDEQYAEYLDQKWEAMNLLEQINPKNAELLNDRYFEGKSIAEIAEERFITERQAQRKEYLAIQEFQRTLDKKNEKEAC